ncbi:MAG TPA: hypothetical protein VHO69_18310 [Phototrophicaceae bacterium]|nr:hypothetical protein [Phototrophicaceae bacterium]
MNHDDPFNRQRRYVRRSIPEEQYWDEDDDAPEPYWTLRRIIFLLLVALTLLAFLAYELSFLFQPGRPPLPTLTPQPLPLI